MEEIRSDEAFGDVGVSTGMSILQEIIEKARTEGVQIGVPWSKMVYEYLSEATTSEDLEIILELASGGSYVDLDAHR